MLQRIKRAWSQNEDESWEALNEQLLELEITLKQHAEDRQKFETLAEEQDRLRELLAARFPHLSRAVSNL